MMGEGRLVGAVVHSDEFNGFFASEVFDVEKLFDVTLTRLCASLRDRGENLRCPP